MEILNLLFFCGVFYFITMIDFYVKVMFVVGFSLITSCFLNMDKLEKTDNVLGKIIYFNLNLTFNTYYYLKKFVIYLSTFHYSKILIKYVKLIDKSYVDGKTYLINKITNKFAKPKFKMKKIKKNKDEKKKISDEPVFNSDNDMKKFLDKLK